MDRKQNVYWKHNLQCLFEFSWGSGLHMSQQLMPHFWHRQPVVWQKYNGEAGSTCSCWYSLAKLLSFIPRSNLNWVTVCFAGLDLFFEPRGLPRPFFWTGSTGVTDNGVWSGSEISCSASFVFLPRAPLDSMTGWEDFWLNWWEPNLILLGLPLDRIFEWNWRGLMKWTGKGCLQNKIL